jgi:hypothetical protein
VEDAMKLSPSSWVLLGFLAIAGFFLVTEHTAHVFGVLPYLLLLACPLLHTFMHHGRGGHGNEGGHGDHTDHGDRKP